MQHRGLWTLSRLRPRLAAALAVAFAAVLVALVIRAPITLQFNIGFAIPIFICAWTRSRRFLWALALLLIWVTIAKILWGSAPELPFNPAHFIADRLIAATTLLACAAVAHLLITLIESIDEEHSRLQAILTTVPVGVAIANANSRTIRYNAAAGAILGVEAEIEHNFDLKMNEFTELMKGDSADRSQHGIVRALKGEKVIRLEREYNLPDGRHVVILVSASPLVDRLGKIFGAVSAFVDITEHKQLQEQLDAQRRLAEDASVRKSRFLAAVSHDIRTPANAIGLLAELLQRTAQKPELAADIPNMAQDLKTCALSLVRLVSDVLDLTQFDSAKIELTETEFPLTDFLNEECSQFQPIAKNKGVDFICNKPAVDLVVRADRVKLSRVVGNLINNAIKFTGKGTVTLDISRQDNGAAQIRVSDTGPGIPPAHHQQIFDEYFQLKNANRDRDGGSGLGLAICRRLAGAMGAQLTVDSDEGKGATFTVTIPPTNVAGR